ncbi:MAG TPA: hypothetical protein VIW29_07820 [Polyangiaceae bacterium]
MRVFLFSILTLAVCGACSMSADDASPSGAGSAAGSSGTDTSGEGGSAGELPVSLELQSNLTDLLPRQELDLTLQTSPPGVFRVRFSLPATDGSEPLDAVLGSTEAETDENGLAQVHLTAASASTSFQVRASVGSVVTTRELTVIDLGATSVQIEPVYGGNRPIETWTASARLGTCAQTPVTPDGEYRAEPVGPDELPLIDDVPAGVPVAIELRSGHFVSGCASVDKLPAGPESAPPRVKIRVLDRPIQLDQSQLDVAFALQRPDTAWAKLLSTTSAAMQVALLGTSLDDPDALLDGMRLALASNERGSFDAARDAEDWDALVTSHFGAGADTHLRAVVLGWLGRGQAAFDAAPRLFEGTLASIDERSTELTLTGMAGLTPAQASVTTPSLMTWSADAEDKLLLGTSLYFSASRLLAGLAENAALADHAKASGAAEALALALDCEALGDKLSAVGPSTDLAFGDCDGVCLGALCQGAVASSWKRARDVTSTTPVELAISATAQAEVGDMAELSGFDGTWVGQLPGSALNHNETSTGGPLGAAQQQLTEP